MYATIDTWTDLVTLDMTGNLLTALHVSILFLLKCLYIFLLLLLTLKAHLCKCIKLKRLFLSGELTYNHLLLNIRVCIPFVSSSSSSTTTTSTTTTTTTTTYSFFFSDNKLTFEGIPPGISKLANLVLVLNHNAVATLSSSLSSSLSHHRSTSLLLGTSSSVYLRVCVAATHCVGLFSPQTLSLLFPRPFT